jgi:hypothetical protein
MASPWPGSAQRRSSDDPPGTSLQAARYPGMMRTFAILGLLFLSGCVVAPYGAYPYGGGYGYRPYPPAYPYARPAYPYARPGYAPSAGDFNPESGQNGGEH